MVAVGLVLPLFPVPLPYMPVELNPHDRTVPLARSAKLVSLPATSALISVALVVISVAVLALVHIAVLVSFVPSPISPLSLLPQHHVFTPSLAQMVDAPMVSLFTAWGMFGT